MFEPCLGRQSGSDRGYLEVPKGAKQPYRALGGTLPCRDFSGLAERDLEVSFSIDVMKGI